MRALRHVREDRPQRGTVAEPSAVSECGQDLVRPHPATLASLRDDCRRGVQGSGDADDLQHRLGGSASRRYDRSQAFLPVRVPGDHKVRASANPSAPWNRHVHRTPVIRSDQAELLCGGVVTPSGLRPRVEQRRHELLVVPDRPGVCHVHTRMDRLPAAAAKPAPYLGVGHAGGLQLCTGHDAMLLVNQDREALVVELLPPPPIHRISVTDFGECRRPPVDNSPQHAGCPQLGNKCASGDEKFPSCLSRREVPGAVRGCRWRRRRLLGTRGCGWCRRGPGR